MTDDKPFSPACERNREPILQSLQTHFAKVRRVLEIGSGTGQHAVHFAAAMPWLQWQCSDRRENLPGIRAWLAEAALPNTPAPLPLDVSTGPWLHRRFDAVFSANTLHIMAWPEVEAMFAGLNRTIAAAATVVVYGPFNYRGRFTSDSNREFDASLRTRDPRMGVRDIEAVDALAAAIGLARVADRGMPANNRLLVWRRG
jgi:cyclopropane fatty-acyl-phospholipid synthase-like methyltransferase